MVIKSYEVLKPGQIVQPSPEYVLYDHKGDKHKVPFMVLRIIDRKEYEEKKLGGWTMKDQLQIEDPDMKFYEISVD